MIKKKEVKTKKMTIDKLAVLMKAGFGGVSKKVGSINTKVESINTKVDNAIDLIDKLAASTLKGFEGFEGVEKRFESIEAKMATKDDIKNLETKIEGLDDRLKGTDKRIDDYAETKVSKVIYKGLENRVGFIEKKLEIK